MKFYYNPTNGLFQPLLFDAHKGAGTFYDFIISDFILYPIRHLMPSEEKPVNAGCQFICKHYIFYLSFLKDKKFFDKYIEYLKYFSSENFIENIHALYKNKYEKLDNAFYSSFSRSDGIMFRGMSLYLFKFDEIENRAKLIKNRLKRIEEHYDYLFDKNEITNNNYVNEKKIISKTKVIEYENYTNKSNNWVFNEPTIIIFKKNTTLNGKSDDPLVIKGPVMFVQIEGTLNANNVIFQNLKNYQVDGKNWSGAINILSSSNINLDNVKIENSKAEDAINIVNSKFNINKLYIVDAESDAVDLDFSNGFINFLACSNIKNDCLDTSDSIVKVDKIIANKIGDKAISAGEKSNIKISHVDISETEIGLVSKDGSNLNIENADFLNVKLAVASFIKKPEYSLPSLKLDSVQFVDNTKLKALIGNDINYQLPNSIQVIQDKSQKIEKRMYGNEFGAATIK